MLFVVVCVAHLCWFTFFSVYFSHNFEWLNYSVNKILNSWTVHQTTNLVSKHLLSSDIVAFSIIFYFSHQILRLSMLGFVCARQANCRLGESWGMCPWPGHGFPHPHQPVWSGHFFTSAPLLHRAPGLPTTHRINPYNKAGGWMGFVESRKEVMLCVF